MTPAEVRQWAPHADGRRDAFFDVAGRVRVKCEPLCGTENEEALLVARDLANQVKALAERDAYIDRLRKQVELLSRELRVANGRILPAAPVRLLGTGFVRFRDGQPWLLSRRERGWAEFGVRCESWDDLFRRYDVRVTEHGTDEHGPWWKVDAGRAALAAYEAGK